MNNIYPLNSRNTNVDPDTGEHFELAVNSDGEYFVPEPDLNMVCIELVNNQIETYYQNSRGMDFNWQKAMAQACIQMIITNLQENL